jgi:predicted nuclease of predicted toxin-antitoxin system
MKILVDENIPRMTVLALREAGHDVMDLRGTPDEGLTDPEVWQRAQSEQRLLITTDRGFGLHRLEPHSGVLIARLRQPNRLRLHGRILIALAQFSGPEWTGLTVVIRDSLMNVYRSRPDDDQER